MEKIIICCKYKGEAQEIIFESEMWTYGCVLTKIAKHFDIKTDHERHAIVARDLLRTNDFDNEFTISSDSDTPPGRIHTLYLNRFARMA